MAALEQELPLQKTSIWQLTLRDKLAPLTASYDWIVLDFPPNLGVMAICGLVASHKVIIPVPSKYLDWQALRLLLDTVIKVRHPVFNPDLEVAGVLVTLHDKRTRSGREIAEVLNGEIYAELPKFPFEIPYAVAFPDASLEGRSLVALAREPGATPRQKELASLYHALAKEVTNGVRAPAHA